MSQKVVGQSITRARVIDKVTGSQKYNGDRKVSGMLFGKLLRSKHAKARILKIDVSAAVNLKGVIAVYTAEDISQPIPKFGSVENDQPILASNETKYYGEPIAIVVAESEAIANGALRKIEVEYEELQAVISLEQALAKDAPLVHQLDDEENKSTNIYGEYNYSWGDIEKARDNAKISIRNTYTFPMVFHFPIESYSCIAIPEDDEVVIRSPIQHPFILQRVISSSLNIPLGKVRVIADEIGGGFGGKGYPKIEPLAAYLAIKLRKPVKISLDMKEGFLSTRRSSTKVDINTGFDEDGRIVYQDIKADFLIGAYIDAAPRVVAKSTYLACGPYRTPNTRIVGRSIYSNTVPSSAFRGFGMPQLIWALESQMNEASRQLGIDAVELRLRNLPEKGEILVPNDLPVDGEWAYGLRKAAELIEWQNSTGENRGKGISIGIKSPIPASVSNALVKLHADGSATVCVGTTDMGQGARTVMGQLAAEALEIPYESISVIMGDTSLTPFDQATAGSRSTVTMGKAVVEACDDILKQLKTLAIQSNEIEPHDVTIKDGIIAYGNNQRSYKEFLEDYFGAHKGNIIGKGTYRGRVVPENPLGGEADFWEVIFTGVEVEVDKHTGKINVLKLANVSDVGKVINPIQAEGQEEGGSVMAIGHTTMEHLIYNDKGILINGNPTDYCIPTMKDIPKESISSFVENGDGPGPYGAKGLGESSAIPISPAISLAVYNATGIVFKDLPITPEKVYLKLKEITE